MMSHFSKKLIQFYQFSILFVMICTLGTILYFWKLGFIDGSRSKNLHKASFIVESYQKKASLDEIYNNVINENPRLAIKKAKAIESDFAKVNSEIEVEGYNILKDDIQKLKTSAANLISFSKVDKVINVFNLKMNKFHDYVKTNRWRTLSRMSDRVFSQTKGHVNKNKLSSLIRNVDRDFETMIKVTENSVLSRKDKSEVVSRITNLQIEMQMLKKYSDEIKFFKQLNKDANKSLVNWIGKVSPEITLQKLKIEQIGKFYVMGLLGILLTLTTIFFGSFAFNRFFLKRSQEKLESFVEGYINDQIISSKALSGEEFGHEFKEYTKSISNYFHKRMSFGSIFQDALPLSSILLDKNLKVVWSNKQFCNDWSIDEDEINKDYMSWDFLSKLTNIGNNDPVLEALKNNVAGIYQVQVKANEESDVKPFEMFVSPVKYQGEVKIMVFFYNLTNIEQTIQDQAQTLISPIRKTLTMMLTPNADFNEDIVNEFHIAGIDDVYESFQELKNKSMNTENQLIDQIEMLHGQIQDFETLNNENQENLDHIFSSSKSSTSALKTFKNSVIAFSSISRDLNRIGLRSKELFYTNINALKNSANKVSTFKDALDEILFTLPKFNMIKEEVKLAKANLYESKSKLGHELSQFNIFLKRDMGTQNQENVLKVATKLNATFESLNQYTEDLDRKISNLELLMSKSGMVIDNAQSKIGNITADYELQQAQISQGEVSTLTKGLDGKTSEIDDIEMQVVESLQEIFTCSKNQLAYSSEIRKSISQLQL